MTTKKKPADDESAGKIKGGSLTTEVYHSNQPQEAHYDPETGDYDGQLVAIDLVDQLDPPTTPEHPLPIPDNTVRTLFNWAMDLDITQGSRMVLLTVIRHVKWKDGTECTASIPTLAREAHLSERSTKGHIKALIDAGLISRKRRMNRTWTTDLITCPTSPRLVKKLPSRLGEAASPTGGRSGFTTNQLSSSTNLSNQSVTTPRLRKKQETKTPGTKETEIPLEEEKTKTTKEVPPPKVTAHAEAVDAWLETNMPASPMPSFAEAMLKHYKKHWWQPFVTDGWHTRTTVAEAAAHVTKDLTQWQKFRVDLRDKMLVGGLPPAAPDGTAHAEVLCEFLGHVGERMTAAYGSQTVFSRKEGPGLIDRCDVCLTPEMVGV